MTGARPYLARFLGDEGGNGTIEFVLMLPMMMYFFLSTFELGMTMTRQVMLDRGVDLVVRELRLGAYENVPVANLMTEVKSDLCEFAAIIPDCASSLKLEMRVIDPLAWSNMPNDADCVDRGNPGLPVREFTSGGVNDLMIMRACVLFEPYLPTSGLGAVMPRESGDEYALISISSYAVEPN